MIKRILFYMLTTVFGYVANAQTTDLKNEIAPTTAEEYNYGFAGYRLQLNMKLPMKEGYFLKEYKPVEEAERSMEFKGVLRKGETKPCVIIMVFTKLRTPPQYYAIPTTDAPPELWKKFYESLMDDEKNNLPQLQFFTMCLGNLSQQLAHQ
ncbi:MAG TPA: hypothetical protein PKN75_03080 [Bacteroidia bacterium]|nr:hypothetical protein [Bacteroidia bacterium]HNU32551.1 hypothetical protein [Bacteroidia bacterium]